MRKTRPCVVVSPDELNPHLHTVLVVPATSGGQQYHHRVETRIGHRVSGLATDQMRAVDRKRIVGHMGRLASEDLSTLLQTLREMFEE